MHSIRNVCVFCGSAFGNDPDYVLKTETLAHLLVQKNIHIIYGGGKNGLMGKFADTALKENGKITGVISKALIDLEVEHKGISNLIVTEDIHTRKAKMAELSDAFIVLPGGLGTIEEMFEVISWYQLGLHNKPCGVLNINGFFDYLFQFMGLIENKGFMRITRETIIVSEENPEQLLLKMGIK